MKLVDPRRRFHRIYALTDLPPVEWWVMKRRVRDCRRSSLDAVIHPTAY